MNLRNRKIDQDISSEKEKINYLESIFLDLTSYQKLNEAVSVKEFEKDSAPDFILSPDGVKKSSN